MKINKNILILVGLFLILLSVYFIMDNKLVYFVSSHVSSDHKLSEANIVRLEYTSWTLLFLGLIILYYCSSLQSRFIQKKSKWFLSIFKNKNLFPVLLLFFMLTRLWLLFTSQSQLDDDEAVIGLMSKHISEGKSFPFFFYGEYYNGGAALSAYLTSILFLIFGVHPILVKIFPFIFSILFFYISFLFAKKYFSLEIANLTSLFMVFSSSFFFIWNLKNRGGYTEFLFFSMLAIWFYFDIFYGKKNTLSFVFLGLTLSLLLWISQSSIILILYLVFFTVIFNRSILILRQYLIIVISFVIGLLPLIFFNLNNCFINISNLFKFKIAYQIFDGISNILGHVGCSYPAQNTISTFIPIKFIFFDFIRRIFGENKMSLILLVCFVILLVFMIYKIRVTPHLRTLYSSKYFLLILFPIFWIIFFEFYKSWQLRHLYIIYLVFFIILAIIINFSMKYKYLSFQISFIFIILLLLSSFNEYYQEYKNTHYTDYQAINSIIKDHGGNFYGTSWLTYAIIFYSNESNIGSCKNIDPCPTRYPPYDKKVNESDEFVIVLPSDSDVQKYVEEQLIISEINFTKKECDANILKLHDELYGRKITPKVTIYSFQYGDEKKPVELIDKKFWLGGFDYD